MLILLFPILINAIPYEFEIPEVTWENCPEADRIRGEMIDRKAYAIERWEFYNEVVKPSLQDISQAKSLYPNISPGQQFITNDQRFNDLLEEFSTNTLIAFEGTYISELFTAYTQFSIEIPPMVQEIFEAELPEKQIDLDIELEKCQQQTSLPGNVELYMPLNNDLTVITKHGYLADPDENLEIVDSHLQMTPDQTLRVPGLRHLDNWQLNFDILVGEGESEKGKVPKKVNINGFTFTHSGCYYSDSACEVELDEETDYTGFLIAFARHDHIKLCYNLACYDVSCPKDTVLQNELVISTGGQSSNVNIDEIWLRTEVNLTEVTPNIKFDCIMDWDDWGSCDATCGVGTKTRSGTILSRPQNGGDICPISPEHRTCNSSSVCPLVLPETYEFLAVKKASEAEGFVLRDGNLQISPNSDGTLNVYFESVENLQVGDILWEFKLSDVVDIKVAGHQLEQVQEFQFITTRPVDGSVLYKFSDNDELPKSQTTRSYRLIFKVSAVTAITYIRVSLAEQEDSCAPGCPLSKLSDGVCDEECLTEACKFDKTDCGTKQCAEGCYYNFIGDKICQRACYNEACSNDAEDCDECIQNGCDLADVANGICDEECNIPACFSDGGDCKYTGENCFGNCYQGMIGDGVCQVDCFNSYCNYDNDDCGVDPKEYCSPTCHKATLLHNGVCNPDCLTFWCRYDLKDCEVCAIGCAKIQVGDGFCQPYCNVAACQFDKGDCAEAEFCNNGTCDMRRIGDSHCNAECLTEDCEYDGGDCKCYLAGCKWYQIENGVCDEACNIEECGFDGGDC